MDQHLVAPHHGRILCTWLAEESREYHVVVEEGSFDHQWLLLYEWDAGWDLVASFQMGFLEDYREDLAARFVHIINIGENMADGGDTILVVEESVAGFWLIIYEWMYDWDEYALRMVYFVDGGHYSIPLVEVLDVSEISDGDDHDPVIRRLVQREETPDLSDQDYQDLNE
jgi:hypothetical protein